VPDVKLSCVKSCSVMYVGFGAYFAKFSGCLTFLKCSSLQNVSSPFFGPSVVLW
jgi:hypothetical protein